MPTTTPAPNTTGKNLLEGLMAWRAKDDSADNFVANLYSHIAIEFSATEATEWVSFFMFLSQVVKVGGGALAGINKTGGTLPIGPVAVGGYDSTSGLFTLIAADPALNIPAMAFLLAPLVNNATGVAYLGGATGAAVSSGLNQTATAVGTKVYLQVGGGLTFTPDYTQAFYQVVGYTTDQLNPGNMFPHVEPPLSASNIAGTGIIRFPEVDLKTLATTTFNLPTGVSVNPDEVGLQLTTLGGSMVTQPTFTFGIPASNAKYLAAQRSTDLTAVGKRQRYTHLDNAAPDDAETSFTFTVTVVAAGSAAIKGKPYVRGMPA